MVNGFLKLKGIRLPFDILKVILFEYILINNTQGVVLMLCATFRMKDVKIFGFILGAIVLMLGAIFFTYKHLTKDIIRLSTYSQRVEYLESLDISTNSILESSKDITIPTEFNETYEQYANVQLNKGFPNLHTFKGESATVYNYTLQDGSNIQLLICDDILVGSFFDNH